MFEIVATLILVLLLALSVISVLVCVYELRDAVFSMWTSFIILIPIHLLHTEDIGLTLVFVLEHAEWLFYVGIIGAVSFAGNKIHKEMKELREDLKKILTDKI
jgi:uncharacterized membrane protein YhaH (DUF805 family)